MAAPQGTTEAQTTEHSAEVVRSAETCLNREPGSGSSSALGVGTEAFDTTVEDIRSLLWSSDRNPLVEVASALRSRFRLPRRGLVTALLAASFGAGVRLALALVVTAVARESTPVPWGRWALILVFSGLLDATGVVRAPLSELPAGARARKGLDDWTAMLPTVERESDLREVACFAHRWIRPPVAAVVGVGVATVVLSACWLAAPEGISELAPGSIVLLFVLLVDFGTTTVNPSNSAVFTREAHYDHRLFWASPADSPEVQRAVRSTTIFGFVTGLWVTIYLVLAVVLVSWDSPLVVPLSVGFLAIGYLFAFVSAACLRSAIEKIVRRSRDRQLGRLREEIGAMGPGPDGLSTEGIEHARYLIELHNTIRDAPTTPTAAHTLMRSAAGLIVPTIAFVITIFGEVSAERLLDAMLP